jgi:tetraacyldisaccharide 4'-kinase
MEKIWLKIIDSRSNPLYWPLLFLLWVISQFYRAGLFISNLVTRVKIRTTAPLVSIGNLTVGGSGKTPLVMEIARYMLGKKLKVAVVSSGYGRSNTADIDFIAGQINGIQIGVDDVGDEVKMMAESLPGVIFGISRIKAAAAGRIDRNYNPDIIIVDDAFQHRKLYRDLNLLVIDSSFDTKRERLFPFGRLREPLGAIKRANTLIITKANWGSAVEILASFLKQHFNKESILKVYYLNDEIISLDKRLSIENIQDCRIYFFAGIGNFGAMGTHIKKIFPNLAGLRSFPDHCRYTHSDIKRIKGDVEKYQVEYLLTTLKDFVKVRNFDFGVPIYYLGLQLDFGLEGDKLFSKLDGLLKK